MIRVWRSEQATHPTTSLCVRFLEQWIDPNKDTVIDVGCGSGILSIAAALLGAKDVLAVDIDPVAAAVSKENVALNGLNLKVRVREGDLTKGLSERADIIVANLMADLVMLLSKDVAAHLKGKCLYISSGILIEKQEEVVAAIEECGFRIVGYYGGRGNGAPLPRKFKIGLIFGIHFIATCCVPARCISRKLGRLQITDASDGFLGNTRGAARKAVPGCIIKK